MSTTVAAVPRRGIGVADAIRHQLIIARRNLLHIRSDPEQMVGMTIQPLMFLLLFVFVFGGAIAGSSRQYLQFALPGIIVQTVTFTGFQTALGLNIDFQRGLIDRFRSLPISQLSVVGGRVLADAVRVLWGLLIILGLGMLLGFRFHGGVAGAIGGVALATLFGVAMCWPMALIGITAKTPEAVNSFGFLLILPLTFGSSVFAPPSTMPGWLQAFVKVNPISKVVDATRSLMLGGPVATPLWQSIVWIVVITAVFMPLTIRRYRHRV